ncbi:unnamed protein product [Ilex paraguariensis]|uniref:Uncharacterized protein n=1 Tax=Ilex paraguariensis TaxID=185542 RepID=A0ABC8URZ7_9AQUA
MWKRYRGAMVSEILSGGIGGDGVDGVEVGGAGSIDRGEQRAGEEDRETKKEGDREYLDGFGGSS